MSSAVAASGPRFFFIHVMKTGGTTLWWHARANFGPHELYPHRGVDPDGFETYAGIRNLVSLPEDRKRSVRFFMGHFPFVVTELLGGSFVNLTILRNPIERTISYLQHCQRYQDGCRDLQLEQIYEDPVLFHHLIHNHQTKMFAMTALDSLETYLDPIEIDDRRLDIAKANLEKVEVLGFSDEYEQLLVQLERDYSWRIEPVPKQRESVEISIAPSFARRIAQDNAADLEFHDYARELYDARRRQSSQTHG